MLATPDLDNNRALCHSCIKVFVFPKQIKFTACHQTENKGEHSYITITSWLEYGGMLCGRSHGFIDMEDNFFSSGFLLLISDHLKQLRVSLKDNRSFTV